jgi:hypothetical protein
MRACLGAGSGALPRVLVAMFSHKVVADGSSSVAALPCTSSSSVRVVATPRTSIACNAMPVRSAS